MRRYWWLPLVIAGLFDLMLILHARFSAGAQVDKAVRRSLLTTGCRETILIRGNGLPDQVSVLSVTVGAARLNVMDMSAEFGPNGALTPASMQNIALGEDTSVGTTPLVGASAHPLLRLYTEQLHAGLDWLSGACLPLPNPRTSRLQAAGILRVGGTTYRVYRGSVSVRQNGNPVFTSKTSVWMGISRSGTLGFTVVQGRPRATGIEIILATMFRYTPAGPMPSASVAAAGARVQFYRSIHASVEDLLARLGLQSSVGSVADGQAL